MKNSEKIILKMKENNGVITTAKIKEMGIDKKIISKLIKNKKIEQAVRGVYILPESLGDEYYNKLYSKKMQYIHILLHFIFTIFAIKYRWFIDITTKAPITPREIELFRWWIHKNNGI